MAGTLPVREFSSVEEMRADATLRRMRLLGLPRHNVVPRVRVLNRAPFIPPAPARPEDFRPKPRRIVVKRDDLTYSFGDTALLVMSETNEIGTTLFSRVRNVNTVRARHLLWWLAFKFCRLSTVEIGRRTGEFDHSTVCHGVAQVDRLRHLHAVVAAEDEPVAWCVALWPILKPEVRAHKPRLRASSPGGGS